MSVVDSRQGIVLSGAHTERSAEILTGAALDFLADLHRRFDRRRAELIEMREERQSRFDAGELPDFLPQTAELRAKDWHVDPVPEEIADRRVEMTGPVGRRQLIEGLNGGARVFMADFEDALSPTWENLLEGQLAVHDRWRDALTFSEGGKTLKVAAQPSVLMTRPRGLHLPESHLEVDGEPICAALFDFGLLAFHNAKVAVAKGSRPYFYLPKLESHLEARWWNDVFLVTEDALGLAPGTIKATVLIETLPAAFEMDEILFELRNHIVGLTCGRWDYIFSLIKTFRTRPAYLLPDRNQVDMGAAFLRAYSELLIKTCHRRGTLAIGGMSAYIPVAGHGEANERALAAIRKDKEREAKAGHDGTWVAHPALIPLAEEAFASFMTGPNQLARLRPELEVDQFDLLELHDGIRTEQGLRDNIRTGIQYLEAWLRGDGAVPLDHVVEDAAIAEISRAQIWQQLRFQASLAEGSKVTPALFSRFLHDEMDRVKEEIGEDAYQAGRFADAITIFTELAMADQLLPFLTLAAYPLIV